MPTFSGRGALRNAMPADLADDRYLDQQGSIRHGVVGPMRRFRARRRQTRPSLWPGFVEPGEAPKQTLEREVFGEVGVRLANLRYFGSQS